jgi:hypothetical protein
MFSEPRDDWEAVRIIVVGPRAATPGAEGTSIYIGRRDAPRRPD